MVERDMCMRKLLRAVRGAHVLAEAEPENVVNKAYIQIS